MTKSDIRIGIIRLSYFVVILNVVLRLRGILDGIGSIVAIFIPALIGGLGRIAKKENTMNAFRKTIRIVFIILLSVIVVALICILELIGVFLN